MLIHFFFVLACLMHLFLVWGDFSCASYGRSCCLELYSLHRGFELGDLCSIRLPWLSLGHEIGWLREAVCAALKSAG